MHKIKTENVKLKILEFETISHTAYISVGVYVCVRNITCRPWETDCFLKWMIN